jgi:hypothetical protein
MMAPSQKSSIHSCCSPVLVGEKEINRQAPLVAILGESLVVAARMEFLSLLSRKMLPLLSFVL